jgi:hypothetical protein
MCIPAATRAIEPRAVRWNLREIGPICGDEPGRRMIRDDLIDRGHDCDILAVEIAWGG